MDRFARTGLRIALFLAFFSMTTAANAADGVILLHGLCRSNSSMDKMASALSEAGFTVENVDYPSRTASIEKLSDAAIGKTLQSPRFASCEKIHFVTHSLGGIMVRSYFKRHPFARLGRVVMLGPPNQGSEVVDELGSWSLFRWLNGPAGDELGTGAGSTPNNLGPVEFDLGVIAGDRSINWINSLMIDGTDDGKVSVARTKVVGMTDFISVHVTHPYLMKDDEVIENTLSFLKTGAFLESAKRSSGLSPVGAEIRGL